MKKLLLVVMCMMLFSSPAYAKKSKKASIKSQNRAEKVAPENKSSEKWLNVEIVSPEREIIKKYYQSKGVKPVKGKKAKKKKKLPYGLKKKVARGGNLPPGWEKKIARGEVLDAEVYKHAEPIPPGLRKKLPPQPEDTALIKVEGKIIRLLKATRRILDVFEIDL